MPCADSGAPSAPAAINCAAKRDAVRTACSTRCSVASQASVSGLERRTPGNRFSTRSTRSSIRRMRAVATSRSIALRASATPTRPPEAVRRAPSGIESRCRSCCERHRSRRMIRAHGRRTSSGQSGRAPRAAHRRAAPGAATGGGPAPGPPPKAPFLRGLSPPHARGLAAPAADRSAGALRRAHQGPRPSLFAPHPGPRIRRAKPTRSAGARGTVQAPARSWRSAGARRTASHAPRRRIPEDALHIVLHVFPQYVGLEIDSISDPPATERRRLEGVGDERHVETPGLYADHGQGDSVDGHGALLDQKKAEVRLTIDEQADVKTRAVKGPN